MKIWLAGTIVIGGLIILWIILEIIYFQMKSEGKKLKKVAKFLEYITPFDAPFS